MRITTKTILRTLVTLCFAGPLVLGLAAQNQSGNRVSLATDWSHRHVRYSNTGTLQARVSLSKDPRALHNYVDRAWRPNFQAGRMSDSLRQPNATATAEAYDSTRRGRPFLPARAKSKNSDIDWALTLGTGGAFPTGETPAKFQFDVTQPPDCTNDFVVFPINATPNAAQANIIAVNNLYAGTNPTGQCGTAPTVMWSYKIGTAGTALSPSLSFDGKKVAFIETGNPAIFHVLTWQAGQGTSATAPYAGTPNDVALSYTTVAGTGCTNASARDSNASPYIDYTADGAFLAANNGILYHVKNVFGGTPTMDFCTVITANASLTSPVYDANVNKVFISDGASVFSVDFNPSTGFSNKKSVTVAGANGIILSPIIDGSSQMVYVFSASKAGASNSIVSQLPYALTTHTDVNIGAAATGYVLDGTFDNNFYTNPDPTTWTLYACGRTAASASAPALYGITFGANGVMNTTPAFGPNTTINPGNAAGACSPLQEFYNAGIDRLFVSTTGSSTVSMYNITNRLTGTSTATATAPGYSGGTGSFAVDNVSPAPQASSIYFGTMGTSTTTCPVATTTTLTEQSASAASNVSGKTLTVSIPATTAGDMIVVAVGGSSSSRTVSSVTDNAIGGSNTYTQVSNARHTATNIFADVWVSLKTANSGATVVTITYSNNVTLRDAEVWVVSGFSNATVDVVSGINNGVTSGGTSTGASVTTTTPVEFIAAFITSSATVTANPKTGNEFTSGGDINGNGDAGASLITTTAGAHQPVWTDTGTAFASATVAFKENTAATANYCAVKLTQSALQ